MSERSKVRRAQRSAREEKQAKTVMRWLIAIFIILTVACLAVYTTM